MNIEAIRTGIAANLEAIPGAQISPYILGDPTLPCVFVQPEEVDFTVASQRGAFRVLVFVTVMVSAVSDVGGQKLLDEFLSTPHERSVKDAIESDPTLGGAALDLVVQEATGYQVITRADRGLEPALGATWTVELYARGDE